MITILDNVIKICSYKLTATKGDKKKYTYYFRTKKEADSHIKRLKAKGFKIDVKRLDTKKEQYLDGQHCTSISEAKKWLKQGEIVEPLTTENIIEVLADLIGGAI